MPNPTRRAFFERFAGTATLAAAGPLPAVAVDGDLYVNHRVGVAFRKPPGWRYENLRTFAAIRNEYEYATPDDALAAELKNGQLPIVVVSRDGAMRALTSSVTVYVEENPLEPGETPAMAAPDIVRGLSSFFKNFRVIGEPDPRRVAGCDAVENRFGFLYEDRLGNRGPVRCRSIAVLNGPLLFTFNMMDIPAAGVDSQAEFDALRDSIVLAAQPAAEPLTVIDALPLTRESVVRFLHGFEARAERENFDLVQDLIHPDAVFRFNDGDFIGLAAIRAAFEKTWKGAPNLKKARFYLSDIRVLSVDQASASATYTWHWEGSMDGKAFAIQGRGTRVLVAEGGRVQIIHEHLSRFPR